MLRLSPERFWTGALELCLGCAHGCSRLRQFQPWESDSTSTDDQLRRAFPPPPSRDRYGEKLWIKCKTTFAACNDFWNAESGSQHYYEPFWSSGPGSCGRTGWRWPYGHRPTSLVPSGGTDMRWRAPTEPAYTADNQWRRARGGLVVLRSLLLIRPCRTQSPPVEVSVWRQCSCGGDEAKEQAEF